MADQQGCPRCKDYESIKDQLENTKSQREKEVKDKLKSCEDHTKHLQKKLLTVGAAAVIGGTILGKEFVDKIADYIDSFNDVKTGATKLIGAAPSTETATQPVVQAKADEEEKDEKKEDKRDDPWSLTPPSIASTGMDELLTSTLVSGLGSYSYLDTLLTEPLTPSSLSEEIDLVSSDFEMGTMFMEVPSILTIDLPQPEAFSEIPQSVVVPAPGFLGFIPMIIFMGGRRRRR